MSCEILDITTIHQMETEETATHQMETEETATHQRETEETATHTTQCVICRKPDQPGDKLKSPSSGLSTIKDYCRLLDKKDILAFVQNSSNEDVKIHKKCQRDISNE